MLVAYAFFALVTTLFLLEFRRPLFRPALNIDKINLATYPDSPSRARNCGALRVTASSFLGDSVLFCYLAWFAFVGQSFLDFSRCTTCSWPSPLHCFPSTLLVVWLHCCTTTTTRFKLCHQSVFCFSFIFCVVLECHSYGFPFERSKLP